jgi:uncharacterized transporter YbjL
LLAVPFTASLLVIQVIAVLYGLGFSMDIGQTAGPIITGLIIGTTLQYLDGFWFLGISLIATAVLFTWFFRSHLKER